MLYAQLTVKTRCNLLRVINSGPYGGEEAQPASAVYVLHPEQHVLSSHAPHVAEHLKGCKYLSGLKGDRPACSLLPANLHAAIETETALQTPACSSAFADKLVPKLSCTDNAVRLHKLHPDTEALLRYPTQQQCDCPCTCRRVSSKRSTPIDSNKPLVLLALTCAN